MFRIDAHHHLWRYTPEEYGWLDDSMAGLRRDFLLEDLRRVLQPAAVDFTIAVQARQTLEETRWLLELAERPSPIAGVVGWLPLADSGIEAVLDEFTSHAALKGVRHVVQAEPSGFLDGKAFNRGVGALRDKSLVYDILIFGPQLREATRFVDRHPNQTFVLDHIAKPAIKAGEIEPWAAHLRELARRPHVSCKLSGMVTEADPSHWTPQQLEPYFDVVLQAFGPERLMIGTDWPVLTVGSTYLQWWRTVEHWVAALSLSEQERILGDNAARTYSLQMGKGPAQLQSMAEPVGALR